MADPGGNTLPRIARAEHVGPNDTGDNIEAKRVVNYAWNGSEWERASSTSGVSKATAAYSISAISETATNKYFFFEDKDLNWYIMRKNLTTLIFSYTKGIGGYTSVYVDATSAPSGSLTFATYGATF